MARTKERVVGFLARETMMCNRERAKIMIELGQTDEAQELLCKISKCA